MNINFILPALVFLSVNSYACDRAYRIILNNDTLITRDELPINKYFKPFSFYKQKLSYQGGVSTACGPFSEIWKIANDSLHLNNISGCDAFFYVIDDKCLDSLKKLSVPLEVINKIEVLKDRKYFNSKHIWDDLKNKTPRKLFEKNNYEIFYAISKCRSYGQNYLDFKNLVKKKYLDNNLFFYNYSGGLSVPVGNTIDSMMVEYHFPTDRDLFIFIEKGIVADTYYVNPVYHNSDAEGKELLLYGHRMFLPDHFVQSDSIQEYQTPILSLVKGSDTSSFTYIDTLSSSTIHISLNKTRFWKRQEQHTHQKDLIKNKMSTLSNEFTFSGFNFSKVIYVGRFINEPNVPGICWVNGNGKKNKQIKIITVSSSVAVIEILFYTNKLTDDFFDKIFYDIIESISVLWMHEFDGKW